MNLKDIQNELKLLTKTLSPEDLINTSLTIKNIESGEEIKRRTLKIPDLEPGKYDIIVYVNEQEKAKYNIEIEKDKPQLEQENLFNTITKNIPETNMNLIINFLQNQIEIMRQSHTREIEQLKEIHYREINELKKSFELEKQRLINLYEEKIKLIETNQEKLERDREKLQEAIEKRLRAELRTKNKENDFSITDLLNNPILQNLILAMVSKDNVSNEQINQILNEIKK
jgi:IS4 transposase